jgi:hypothetical protein
MYQRRLVALGIVALLAACGGGGGSSSSGRSAPLPNATVTTAKYASASFSITIPSAAASAARRAPKTVPAGTKSIKFTLLKTDATGVTTPSVSPVYPLLSTSPGCAAGQGGISCTISLSAPIGTNIYLAEVFTTADGSGTHIGSGAVKLTVVANSSNTASLTLAGPIAAAYVATDDVPTSSFYSNGPSLLLSPLANQTYNEQSIPVSARIFVIALDAQGDQIISPDTFDRPVLLTLNYVQTGYQISSTHRSTRGNGPDPTQFATLSTTYAFPSGGVTSAATSSANPTINIFSPADQTVITPINTTTGAIVSVTASIGGVAQPLDLVYTILDGSCPAGDTGSAPFTCVPPTPTPGPSPSPSPSPSPTPLMWPAAGPTQPPNDDSAVYYPINTYAPNFNVSSNVVPILDFASLPQQNLSNAFTLALTGGATMTTGGQVTLDASSCQSNIAVTPTSPIATNGSPIFVTITNTAASAIGCIVNASDGTTTAPLQIYVENHTFVVNGVKKK